MLAHVRRDRIQSLHLCVGKQVIVWKVRYTQLSSAGICKRNTNSLCLCFCRQAGCTSWRSNFDCHHNRCRCNVGIGKEQVLYCLQVTRGSLGDRSQYMSGQVIPQKYTSLSKRNLVARFPCPASGTHISTLSCLLVRASRRNVFALFELRVTLGSPSRPPGPRYLITVFVR